MTRKTNLIINEPPLQVLPSLAIIVGLNEAIALQQLHYWLMNPKIGKEIDGYKWVYNNYDEWQRDNFPFWSVRTVQRVFLSLENIGVVISIQPESRDRTKYYRIDYDKLALWTMTDCVNPEFQDGTMEDDKLAHSSLTETTTETTTLERVIISANKTVDALLENARIVEEKTAKRETWPHREKFPDPIRELMDVYVKLTGQHPTKRDVLDWLSEGQDWLDLGITRLDLENAYKKSKPDDKGYGGFSVARPGSLTRTAGMFAGERRTNGNGAGMNKYDRALAELENFNG